MCTFPQVNEKCRFSLHRNQDPYEKSLMNSFLHQSSMMSSSDDIPLRKTALETLYDEDEIMDTAQTMPWFDPKYLAENVNQESSKRLYCL